MFFYTVAYTQGNISSMSFEKFYFDAIVFKGDSIGKYRVDCYLILPYETLKFEMKKKYYIADFNILTTVKKDGSIILSKKIDKKLSAEDFNQSMGAQGEFYNYNEKLYLPEGNYEIEIKILDKKSDMEWIRSRSINIVDFDKYNFSLSGIMLLSMVEESGTKYKITPHISDNIGNLENGFFIFFEGYSKANTNDSIDYIWEVYDSKNTLIAYSNRLRKRSSESVNRQFIKIPEIKELSRGNYTIKLYAMEPSPSNEYDRDKALAITSRSFYYVKTIGGSLINDLDESIKQLRYVATNDDISFINDAANVKDKQRRYEEFWKKLDPSPNTERNEAMEEYLIRLDYANKNFKSYQDGWKTDMGMVYVILGQPFNIDKQYGYGDGKTYQKWSYQNGREFIFIDNSGYGDYRLIRPITFTDKYQYMR